jgi:hypothetical protein
MTVEATVPTNAKAAKPAAIEPPSVFRDRLAMTSLVISGALIALLAAGAIVFASPAAAGGVSGPARFGPETFGFYNFESSLSGAEGGSPAVQAGSHPYAMTTTIMFNHELIIEEPEEGFAENKIYGDPKNMEVNLPVGLIGNPEATETKCTEAELASEDKGGGGCPNSSAVGSGIVYASLLVAGDGASSVYNMVPPPGVAAEFAVVPGDLEGLTVRIYARVRTGGDYGLSGEVRDISQKFPIYGVKLTLWGNPSAASHDAERGACGGKPQERKELEKERFERENKEKGFSTAEYFFSCPVTRINKPFLTMPGSCTGQPLTTTVNVDSWQEPDNALLDSATSPSVTGCKGLAFKPSLSVEPTPEAIATESPSGLNVDLKVPQEENLNGLAEADLQEAVVKLPVGVTVSPSAANGLGACSPEQIGLDNMNAPLCPDSSKVGTVEIETPLLEMPLKGSMFLAQQGNLTGNGSNPFGSLLALYLVAEGNSVLVKLPGKIELDETTGQLTARFGEDPLTKQLLPQLPFSDLKMSFPSGPRAALMTPSTCGGYTTTSQLAPWSGNAPAEPSSGFTVGQGCGTWAFAPSFTAGTTDSQAGGFSPFSVTFSRQGGEQRLSSAQVVAPPGLLGVLKSVVQCPELQAGAGTCGPESLIGETTVAAGPGEDPYWVKGGRVYLTGPYKGAPFGLSIVVPAVAGPFNLGIGGKPVVVRAQIDVDPHTAQITVTSDSLPTIMQGVPLDIRTVNVTINRPGFTFNPTNCSPSSTTGELGSTVGASAPVSSPFEAANCAALPFKPGFVVSTAAKAGKANGASLDVRVASGPGQANIGKVKVDLPKQLPSRLTTLQKACVASVFEANPASCPAASNVGTATAVTPLLANPVTGPAYLDSHGGAAFPDLEIVLQGEGIVLILDGNTDIKKGITTSTFKSLPDAPISSFELKLPMGKYSILGANVPASANYSLCGQTLAMPTEITGQNGAVVKQITKIAVTGCTKVKAPTRTQKLAAALKTCRKKSKGKRAGCEKQARKKYAPVTAGADKKHNKKHS